MLNALSKTKSFQEAALRPEGRGHYFIKYLVEK